MGHQAIPPGDHLERVPINPAGAVQGLRGLQHRGAGNFVFRYGLALVSVTVALGITQLLQPTVFPTPLFFVAIVVSTWFGGTGAGILAVLCATALLHYYFVSADRGFAVNPTAMLYLAQFSLPALLTCWFVKKRKDAESALKEARDQLDAKVQERTAELQHANDQLQAEIAGRRRTEEAFHKTQADLAHLMRVTSMSALATSIAHEVNQPLAAIVTTGDACLRWLSGNPPNLERAKDSVSRIVNEGNRAASVIKRIRALSTKTRPHKSTLRINDLIHDVITLLDAELNTNKVLLRTELGEGIPPVFGDPVQLQQVILNLLVNAIEALSDVDARARTLLVRSESLSAGRVQVSVRDSGCGIDSNHAAHLFETFYTTKPDGLGMGLSISRSIIEAHGGTLWADSNADRGATFRFAIPIVDESESRQ